LGEDPLDENSLANEIAEGIVGGEENLFTDIFNKLQK
jgi:hypothetical protein